MAVSLERALRPSGIKKSFLGKEITLLIAYFAQPKSRRRNIYSKMSLSEENKICVKQSSFVLI